MRGLSKDPAAQIGRYLDAADGARLRLVTNPRNSLARSDYNFAVSRIVEIINGAGLSPWKTPVSCGYGENAQWRLSLLPPSSSLEHDLSDYEILPADRYDFRGELVGERVLKEGLGAPVITVAKGVDFKDIDNYGGAGQTAFYGLTAVVRFHGRACELQLIDPLAEETVTLGEREYPLAADFQAPLALAMSKVDMKKFERSGMFAPSKHRRTARLVRLQPYHPDKVPVLFIHGLGNSPASLVPMFEYLRNTEEIRKRYQFWSFMYPTGVSYPINAAILRTQLDQMKVRYPDHKDMVVVAHSLGGNITRLLITDTGMKLWDSYYAQPPAQIPFHDETRKMVSEALIFEARPDISRVIFSSASLRGSKTATSFIGRLGTRLIGDPLADDQITEQALSHMRPEVQALGRKHLPNSVDILDPDSLFLSSINALPINPGIPYHTLIGDRGKGGNLDHTEPVSTDGIVPYWSSHLDGAQSELIIPSEHWSILHPLGMAEVKRILLEYD